MDSQKTKNLCLAGGVAMNVKANLEISKLSKVSQIYIPPSPDDSSQSMGACYAYCLINGISTEPLTDAYLGKQWSVGAAIAIQENYHYTKFKVHKNDISKITVKLLLKDKIIGICRGRAEFGARSLGNRSIICSPKT